MAKSFLGYPLNKYLTLIGKDKVLDKKTGTVKHVSKVVQQPKPTRVVASPTNPAPVQKPRLPAPPMEDVIIKKEVEVVVGVDGKKIDLSLVSSEGNIEPSAGFLVEVYLSGTDGKLTRVYQEDLVDVLNDDTLSDGFASYLKLEVDK